MDWRANTFLWAVVGRFEGMGDHLSYVHFSDHRVMCSAAGVFRKEAGSNEPAHLHCTVIDKKGGRRCGTGEGEQTGAAIFSRPGRIISRGHGWSSVYPDRCAQVFI
jgi:hypothetical protein